MSLLQSWKEIWKAPSKGIGDTVAKITKSFGIRPCDACERRRRLFNEMVKYKKANQQETVQRPMNDRL